MYAILHTLAGMLSRYFLYTWLCLNTLIYKFIHVLFTFMHLYTENQVGRSKYNSGQFI